MRKYSQRFNRIQSQRTFFSTDVSLAKKEHTGTLQGGKGGPWIAQDVLAQLREKTDIHTNILLREKKIYVLNIDIASDVKYKNVLILLFDDSFDG